MSETWSAPPLIWGKWIDIEPSDALTLATRIGAAMEARGMGSAMWLAELQRLRAMRLASCPNWLLGEGEVMLSDGKRGLANFLYGPGHRFAMLDYTSGPIHELRASELVPLSTPELTQDYVRLFCGQLAGDEGRFQVIEATEQLMFVAGAKPEEFAQALSTIRPVEVRELELNNDKYEAIATASVLYAGALFTATYTISDGFIQMIDDRPIARLPVRREILAAPLRFLEAAGWDEPHSQPDA